MPIGIITSLIICTLLYVLMGTVLAGIKKYTIYLGDPAAAATASPANHGRRHWSAQGRWRG